ncbi:glycosyltransferase [Rufibacter quisquiliarum]|uniref:Cellulose synthase/poly-beta-1,6-N-acetylglucosamine synthase-like glycosyltransferase n=1 Tax=Rufibacter quisquiliarum TaxID=1549639 RepID=A0A839GH56_9BACT|nr:glycosyltransferase [Rufibacter quisquiliarum]MBA9078222.1 cellulose synthase/poly-beta-1,6-N-acetylglucosamine synthase-like glycosyltransferase [Rufibacter quisquiliarum]
MDYYTHSGDILLYLLGTLVLIQFFYELYYFLPLAFHKDPKPAQPGDLPPLSILVCAHNEVENLKELLPLLVQQEYPRPHEIIIIDDRSRDGTHVLVKEYMLEHPQVKLVRVKVEPEYMSPKKTAIFLGIKAAQYEHLLFTDADCRPVSLQWAQRMAGGFFGGGDIILGVSPYMQIYGFLNHLIRFETFLTAMQYLSFAKRGGAYMGVGRNLAYTKTTFYRNKGFASHIRSLSGDDDLFVQEAAKHSSVQMVIDPEAHTQSAPETQWRTWWQQKRRHLSAGRQYRKKEQVRIGLFVLSNVLFYVISPVLLAMQYQLPWVGVIIGARFVALYGTYLSVAKRLQDPLNWWLLPVLELGYYFNYIGIGISVLRTKKVRWK